MLFKTPCPIKNHLMNDSGEEYIVSMKFLLSEQIINMIIYVQYKNNKEILNKSVKSFKSFSI